MRLRFTIGRKIGLSFGTLILLTIGAFLLTWVTLKDSKAKTDLVTDIYTPSVRELEQLNLLIVESNRLVIKWAYIQSPPDNQDKKNLWNLINVQYPATRKNIEQLSQNWERQEQTDIQSIFDLTDLMFESIEDEVMHPLNSFVNYEQADLVWGAQMSVDDGDIATKMVIIKGVLGHLIDTMQNEAKNVTGDMISSFATLQKVVIYVGLALIIGGVFISLLTIRSIVGPVHQLKSMLLKMGKGILPDERIQERNDEIGEMSIALNGLIDGLHRTTSFANDVGAGNFFSQYDPLSNQDTLGQALLKMRDDLYENERMLETKVEERTQEVVRQKEEIEMQNQKLEVLYKHVTDSIRYAKRLQEAILPTESNIKKLLPNSFVYYRPKDIVSGDFYWVQEKNGKTFFSAVDCTGHGVPGAFMSIVAYNQLKYIITATDAEKPATILDELNKSISTSLNQDGAGEDAATRDGMDLALCSIDYKNMKLEYAGAYNPLYVFREGELHQIKGNKFPVGFFEAENKNRFTNHEFDLKKDDCIYIFSDGFADQFGGPNGKKFMVNNFRELLKNIHELPVKEQKAVLNKTLQEWKGNLDQVDDIVIIGVKV